MVGQVDPAVDHDLDAIGAQLCLLPNRLARLVRGVNFEAPPVTVAARPR
jgi:hypothetical protein